MSWGLVAGAAISVVGGAMASNSSDKAAGQQQAGVQAGIDSEERMFEKSLELQEPYREQGYQALEGLNELNDPTGRESLLNTYYDSGEYQAMNAQAEEQQLRNAASMGQTRGGGNQVAMSTIAPQLGQNYLSNRYNQLTGMANMGMGAASQGANAATNLGGSMNNAANNSASAAAQNSIAQANIWGNVASDVGGFGIDYLNQG